MAFRRQRCCSPRSLKYSEEARKAKFQGTVRLALVVDANGNPTPDQSHHPAGGWKLGSKRAIEAVQKWKFQKPGTKDGKPVAVQASVEVNFRLLSSPHSRKTLPGRRQTTKA